MKTLVLTMALLPSALAATPPLITNTTDRNDYTLQYDVRLTTSRDANALTFEINHADVYFPVVESTGSSTGNLQSAYIQFWWRQQIWTEAFTLLPAKPGFGRYGKLEFQQSRNVFRGGGLPAQDQSVSRDIRILYGFSQVCRETVFDEKRALQIPWPAAFPTELEAWTHPEPMIQSTHPEVVKLVNEWTRGNPRAVGGPVLLAKELCGRVVEHVMPTAPNYRYNTKGRMAGLDVQGAAFAAVEGGGSCFDMAALLVAVYRAAGIPSRLVIGLDVEEMAQVGDPVFLAWAEFALFDPSDNKVEWIPVDVVRQRAFSSRPPPIRQTWEYFGNNRYLDTAFPLGFAFHPPDQAVGATGIVAYGAHALWGWVPSPLIAQLDQRLIISVIGTPQRGGR